MIIMSVTIFSCIFVEFVCRYIYCEQFIQLALSAQIGYIVPWTNMKYTV